MVLKNMFVRILLSAILVLLAANCGYSLDAGLALNTPDRAAKGDAFLATADSSTPVDRIFFFWKGKQYQASAAQAGKDQGAPVYRAQILLPVSLDEKAQKLKLGAGIPRSDGRALQDVSNQIVLYERKRPVQKLTVDKKYVNPPASEQKRIQLDREKVAAVLAHSMPNRAWQLPFVRPVPGIVTSQFGMKRVFNGEPRSVHRGLDLRGATGTPIRACANGKVVLVDNLYYSGNTVYIDHGEGVFSAYLHMSEPKVEVGQTVARGDLVGLVGATGRVTGPHLHLSVIVQGISVDPDTLLEARK